MNGRRTFADAADRERYELDQLAAHASRLTTLEGSVGGAAAIHTSRVTKAPPTALGVTNWTDLDTATDRVITAAAGDVLVVSVSGRIHNTSGAETYFDAVTMVGGVAVTSLGSAAAAPSGISTEGILSLLVPASLGGPLAATVQIVLAPTDVSGGQVRVRLRYRTALGAARSLDRPLTFIASTYTPAL